MKKRFLTASLATMMVLSLAACGGGKAADTTTAPAATEAPADTKAEDKAEETKAEETKAEAEAAGEKAPEDYKGTVVVYSPHDADPLNAGVNLFMEKYPNVKVEVVAAGTGELCNRIAAETANPIADVLWGGGADSLAAFKEYFEPYVCANDEFIGASYRTASPVSALLGLALFGCNEINKQLGVLLIRASLNQGHSIRHSAGSVLRIYKSYRRVILVLHGSLLQGQSHIELTVSHHLMALA